ncbi:MAG TPA: hypothetical protein VFL12_10245, partial [Thermoanaerobaculia bacterium]|nr:hypothetical protein [Thermoanaerobaculia bacterium]
MSPRPRLAFILFVAALTASGTAAAQESYPRFRFSVFGDANLSYSVVSHATEFSFGEIDPYAEARFSESWSALAEVLLHRIERGSNEDKPGKSSVELDLQRFFLAWSRSDALRVQAGQINTGIVAWNEREEVPRFLQTPIDLPAMATRPEQGGAWPLHIVGAWASGSAPGSAGFRYGVGLGAGRGHTREEVTVDHAASPAGVASVTFAPSAVSGWTIGAAAF